MAQARTSALLIPVIQRRMDGTRHLFLLRLDRGDAHYFHGGAIAGEFQTRNLRLELRSLRCYA
jgi:hypothetical protein